MAYKMKPLQEALKTEDLPGTCRKAWIFKCVKCCHDIVIATTFKATAEASARSNNGWKLLAGKWCCRACQKDSQ